MTFNPNDGESGGGSRVVISSWAEFESQLSELRIPNPQPYLWQPSVLFRGQSDSDWRLNDSLLRRQRRGTSVAEYYGIVKRVKHLFENGLGERWSMPELPEFVDVFQDYDRGSLELDRGLPGYAQLLYLRHIGFPSPLLDWTRSPYVAAFFAFRNFSFAAKAEPTIYALVPSNETVVFSNHSPRLYRAGQFTTTHIRHDLQQSDYTYCVQFNQERYWEFTSQADYLQSDQNRQYTVMQFRFSNVDAIQVLRALDRYNLNAHSLFQSPETLAETLAFRSFEGTRARTHPSRPRKYGDT